VSFLEINETIDEIKKFLNLYHKEQISELSYKQSISTNPLLKIEINFSELLKFNHDFGELVEERYEEFIRIVQIASEGLTETTLPIKVLLTNIPETYNVQIRKIRSKHVGKFIKIEGTVSRYSEIKHVPTLKRFECPSCGEVLTIARIDNSLKEPPSCRCGGKGKFRTLSKEVVDTFKMVIEEEWKDASSERPAKIIVEMNDYLTLPEITYQLQGSLKVEIWGVIKEILLDEKKDEYSTYLLANNIIFKGDSLHSIELSKERIDSLSKKVKEDDTLLENLANSLAPTIYGLPSIKKALILSLIGANNIYKDGKLEERGKIHLFFISSPGQAKTLLLQTVNRLIPGSRFAIGSTASGVGLVATVQKDELLGGGWTLIPGSLPLANNNFLAADEIDKLTPEDMGNLNQALDKLEVNIDKASIHVRIETNTTVIAAANPKHRMIDRNSPIWGQIGNINRDLLDRFDLKFVLPDIKREDQVGILDKIFKRFGTEELDKESVLYSQEDIRDLVIIADKLKPRLTKKVYNFLKDEYTNLVDPNGIEEGVYLSNRLLPSIIRLTIASARMRLSSMTSEEDAATAMDLMKESLKSMGVFRMGVLDQFRLERSIPASKVGKAETLLKCLHDIDSGRGVSKDDLVKYMKTFSWEEGEVIKMTELLCSKGDLFEPRRGFYKIL
jgi:replicative DNA helicase Mcm